MSDAELMVGELRQAGFDPIWERVDNEIDFHARLDPAPDIILADYSLPQWNAPRALRVVQAAGLDVPLIVVSGTMSEEAAVACIKQGAADYLLKDRMARLGEAVRKALEDRQLRAEKRRADAALRASETRYRRLFEAAKDGILILDAETGQILDVNPFLLDLLGYSHDEFVNKAIWNIGLFSDLIASGDAFKQLALTEYVRYDDLTLKRKDSAEVAVEFVSNIYRAGGQSVIQCNIRDISQRKQAETELAHYRDYLEQIVEQRTDELSQAKTRLEAILNNTTDGIVLVFPERGIEQQNSTFNLLFASEPDDYFGQPLLNLVHADDRERLAAMIESVRADRVARRDEYRAVRADGSDFDARIGVGSIKADGSLSTGLVCSVQDIRILKQRERELRYHASLQESVTDAVVSNDLEFRIQTWNAAAERIYGWSTQEAIGKQVQEVVQTEWSDQEREQVRRVLLEEGHWQGQVVQRHKDGTRLHILAAISVFKDQYGEPLGVVGINHNITKRVEAEQALLRKTEEELAFQDALKSLHDITLELAQIYQLDEFYRRTVEFGLERLGFERLALFLYDAETNMAVGTYGTDSEGNLVDEGHLRFVSRTDGVMGRSLKHSDRFYLEENVRLSGSHVETLGAGWNAAAILWNGTQSLGWLVADNLLTERPAAKSTLDLLALYALSVGALLAQKQTHAALRESEARVRESQQMLHNLLETMPVRVFWKDRASNYLGANQLYLQDAGVASFDQIVGKIDEDEYATHYRADDQAVMESGIPKVEIEEQVILADGSTIWVQTNKSPLRDSSGAIIGLIGTYIDITQRKQTEQVLERALNEQRELVDLKSRFISMASHDFRTPLSVILSSSDLLRMQITREFGADQIEPLQKRFQRIDNSVQQITSLLDDVLTVNQSDTGKVEIHSEPIELESFCTAILQEIQVAASADHVIISAFVGTATSIRSDGQLLRQILTNLLSNAVKYSPDGGKVLLNVHCEPERVEFRVQDEGIGIPKDDQARLFEVFHRARNVGDIRGTGLGMAIVKRAVDALGGSIDFESQVGVGTAFVVNLPATPDSSS